MNESKNRREFLQAARGLGLGTLALGVGVESARGFSANDTIHIGAIGTGGRCLRLMRNLKQLPSVRLTAVCDIYDANLAEAKKIAEPNAFATKHYPELLARTDVDAVVIASPDHWHVPMTIAACEAGKDVYVEKPLTHNLAEGEPVIEAVNRTERIVQVGMQQRSTPQIIRAREKFTSGQIGTVSKVHLTWNRNQGIGRPNYQIDPKTLDWKAFLGNAPDQPFDPYRFRSWRWFWDFGGGILTDLMVHHLDVVHWFFESDQPALATAMGHNYNSGELWETPDTIHCLLDYPDKKYQVYFEGTFSNSRNRAMIELMGSDATLYMDRGWYEIFPEQKGVKHEKWGPGSDERRGLDFYKNPDGGMIHLANWLDCIRTGKQPNCTVEDGVRAAAGAHLGNRAYRSGKLVRRSTAP